MNFLCFGFYWAGYGWVLAGYGWVRLGPGWVRLGMAGSAWVRVGPGGSGWVRVGPDLDPARTQPGPRWVMVLVVTNRVTKFMDIISIMKSRGPNE